MFLGCPESFHLVAFGCVSEAWLCFRPWRTLNPRTPKPSNLNLATQRWMSRSLTGIMTYQHTVASMGVIRGYIEYMQTLETTGQTKWTLGLPTSFLGMVTHIFVKRSKYTTSNRPQGRIGSYSGFYFFISVSRAVSTMVKMLVLPFGCAQSSHLLASNRKIQRPFRQTHPVAYPKAPVT